MTRGYVVRLLVWAALVVGIAAAGIAWATRTEAVTPAPRTPTTVTAEADPFPAVTTFVTRPLRWVRDGFVFLLEVLFLVGVTRGWIGRGIGIHDLIHAERPGVRFVNGLLLGMAAGNCLFVLYAVNQEGVPWTVSEWPTLLPVDAATGGPGEAVPLHLSGNFQLVAWVPVLLLMGVSKPGQPAEAYRHSSPVPAVAPRRSSSSSSPPASATRTPGCPTCTRCGSSSPGSRTAGFVCTTSGRSMSPRTSRCSGKNDPPRP